MSFWQVFKGIDIALGTTRNALRSTSLDVKIRNSNYAPAFERHLMKISIHTEDHRLDQTVMQLKSISNFLRFFRTSHVSTGIVLCYRNVIYIIIIQCARATQGKSNLIKFNSAPMACARFLHPTNNVHTHTHICFFHHCWNNERVFNNKKKAASSSTTTFQLRVFANCISILKGFELKRYAYSVRNKILFRCMRRHSLIFLIHTKRYE